MLRKILTDDSVLGMFFQVVPICLLISLIYIVIRVLYIKKKKIDFKIKNEIFKILFVCYLTGLVNLVLVPQNLWLKIWYYLFNGYNGVELGSLLSFEFNLIPSIIEVITGDLVMGRWVIKMLIFNILMFIPMGFFISVFLKEKTNNKFLVFVAIVIPFIIEILQMFIGRSFDVDDIICNFLGIIIGYFITKFLKISSQ